MDSDRGKKPGKAATPMKTGRKKDKDHDENGRTETDTGMGQDVSKER